jgi:hypothetical protein
MASSSRRSLFFVVLFLAVCGFLGILFAQKNPDAAPGGDSDVRDSLKQFTEVYETIEQNYADPVNPDKAIYNGAIPSRPNKARTNTIRKRERRELRAMSRDPSGRDMEGPAAPSDASITFKASVTWMQIAAGSYIGATASGAFAGKLLRDTAKTRRGQMW